jgi:HD-like signal output (HDOD) protein
MPNMNGAQLLSKVRVKYPEITRIALSGYSDSEMILESVKATHLYISKPADYETLTSLIERCMSLRNITTDSKLQQFMSGMSSLPCLPEVYTRLLKELSFDDASIDSIGEIIASDMAMTTKLLQIVNSAYFGLARGIVSAPEATAHLGIDVIKSLVLSIKVFEGFENTEAAKQIDKVWLRSQRVGNLAKEIAHREKFTRKNIDQIQVAGMLQDIGALVVMQYFTEKVSEEFLQKFLTNNKYAHEEELKLIGVSHAEISAYLLNLWGIPMEIVECVANHHNSAYKKDEDLSLPKVLYISNTLVDSGADGLDELIDSGVISEKQKASWAAFL